MCEVCGIEMYLSKKSNQRFCSYSCQNIWQKGNVGFNNKRFEGGYVTCENCSKEFIVGKNILVDDRHHFCSTKCRQHWFSTVWSQSCEWKDKSRKRAAKMLKDNPIVTQTKPQIAVNQMLEEMGVNYRNEELFVYYSIDNYLPDYNLAIEVMGDYWHSSPLKYTNNLNSKQQHIVSRDKAKHTFLINSYGIEVLYLWETDINKRPDVCRALIKNYIDNSGILSNYHSFNYEIRGEKVLLIPELIKPHQDNHIQIAS